MFQSVFDKRLRNPETLLARFLIFKILLEMEPTSVTVKTFIVLWCSLLTVQFTHQAELTTKINTTVIYNSTVGLDHAKPPVLQGNKHELRSTWRTEKDAGKVDPNPLAGILQGEAVTEAISTTDTYSSQTLLKAKSSVIDGEDEDFPDVDIVGSDTPDESSDQSNHRQKRTFWPFTSLFGYDYDYPYMPPPPPMFGRPGGFYRPGFGMGGMMGPPRLPPPPMLGLGFSMGF